MRVMAVGAGGHRSLTKSMTRTTLVIGTAACARVYYSLRGLHFIFISFKYCTCHRYYYPFVCFTLSACSLLLPSRHSLFQAEDANEIELLNKLIFNLYLTFISRGTVYDNHQICSPVPDAD